MYGWRAPIVSLARNFHRLARQRALACCLVSLFALLLRLALLPWMPAPLPAVHDEFSNLLAADTFASGRLANPAQPCWQHFETFHVLQQPVYASKYPPLQGLILALGQKLGNPWIGVWLSAGLLCGVSCWMMQGWAPPSVALIGALLLTMRIGVASYWMNSYWGGAVAGIGGALVLGALPRILPRMSRRACARDGFLFALGLAVLANSRPFEGLLLGAMTGGALGFAFWRNRTPFRVFARAFAAPVALTLIPCAAAMAFYNYRITGHPGTMPYQLHESQYAVASAFLWQAPRPEPVYRHEVMRRFWAVWEREMFLASRENLAASFLIKIYLAYEFFLGWWPLLLALLPWPYLFRNARARLALAILGLTLLSFFPVKATLPHYIAPAAGLIYLLMACGIRYWQSWRPVGPRIAAAILAAAGLQFLAAIVRPAASRYGNPAFAQRRMAVVQRLENDPARHLVLVHYEPAHSIHQEWVYNGADPGAARIVWAREMNPDADRDLVRCFPGRKLWRLDADAATPKLEEQGLEAKDWRPFGPQ